jgi:hypothetical protein
MRERIMGRWAILLVSALLFAASTANASVTLLLEEPYGHFGGMNPTGHAAIYLSRVCAATPTSLRRCEPGEQGVVISRYHRVAGRDWLAIPVLAYLYAVDRADQVPTSVGLRDVARLRDAYRRAHLEAIVPDRADGSAPEGDWTQLVGEAYDRTIYAFGVETTETQDDALIERYNAKPNQVHFNLLFHNCADFARHVFDFYYPRAVHRSLIADVGIMTPKQAAECVVKYEKHHRDLQFSTFVIPQVPGTVPRSRPVRGVLESLVHSKRYAVPLVTVAALHPYFGGSLAFAWFEGSEFNPRRIATSPESHPTPEPIAVELKMIAGGD